MDQIEMLWKCDVCHTINGGLSKTCNGCGKALENEEWFMPDDISVNANLTKPEDIDKALRGEDWHCPSCKSSQRRGDGECANCGNKETNTIKLLIPDQLPKKITYTSRYELDEPDYYNSPFYKKPIVWIISSIICITSLVIFLLWPRTVESIVIGSNWTSTVTVERNKIIRDEGWDVPGDAISFNNDGNRIHHYDKVQVGTHQVPYSQSYVCGETCTISPRRCTKNNNGTASCSGGTKSCRDKYCTRTAYRTDPVYENIPRYRNWYSWRVRRWRFDRTVTSTGSDFAPKLPENINLNSNMTDGDQERSSVEWKYIVIFKNKKEEKERFNYQPNSESAFSSFHIGDTHTLKVSSVGVSIEK